VLNFYTITKLFNKGDQLYAVVKNFITGVGMTGLEITDQSSFYISVLKIREA
jgi:hypothetical protein